MEDKIDQQQKSAEKNPTEIDEELYLNSQVFVGGLHPDVTQEDMETFFSKFGEIIEIKLMRDKITSKEKL